jgi:hypothetical protein
MGATGGRVLVALCVAALVAGCGPQEPAPRPTIGSPSPAAAQSAEVEDRTSQLAREWDLTGVPLPNDWPDVPLPRGTQVVTAYAIGALPRRTWTATFTTTSGTALDMAKPVVQALRERGFTPIAEYVGAAATNTGLYSFAAPSFAVYVVLGEDDGQPNLVITVRGSDGQGTDQPAPDVEIDPQARASSAPSPVSSPAISPRSSPEAAATDTSSAPAEADGSS